MDKTSTKTLVQNRQVRHDYFIVESYEAGIELFGTEVKSLRAGTVNLKDSYCEVDSGELFALGDYLLYESGGHITVTAVFCKLCTINESKTVNLG